MGIQLRWDDPDQTILLYEFTSPWAWEDYYRAGDTEWDWLDAVHERVDTILDLRELYKFPKDAAAHLRKTGAHVHRNRGLLVLVGIDEVIQPFSHLLRELYPRSSQDIRLASTLTRARSFISEQFGSAQSVPPEILAASPL